jgi:predicted phosphoadenosine phosphosulfate sulfurtransferase
MKRVSQYIETWKRQGYPDDIPDEVPSEIMAFAPSYKAIAIAILKNDLQFTSLGFQPKVSRWYGEFKRIEIEARKNKP